MGTVDDTQFFTLSRYATMAAVEDGWLIANGMYLERVLLDESFASLCRLLQRRRVRLEDIRTACPRDVDPLNILAFLCRRHLLVPSDSDESQALRSRMIGLQQADLPDLASMEFRWPPAMRYDHPERLSAQTFAMAGQPRNLRVALIGGCMLQFLQETLVKTGLERGFDICIRHDWPPLSRHAERALREWAPDVAILQLTVHPLMTALWDGGALCEANERTERLAALKALMSSSIEQLCDIVAGRFGLVHNFAPPAMSPFGRIDFRTPINFRRIVSDLNLHIDAIASQHRNLMVVDEERLVASHGAVTLFDDTTLPFGHHGGALDPEGADLNRGTCLSHLLAQEYLHCYELHYRVRPVKCVVVDLDNTLWPGVAVEDGFDWLVGDSTRRWISLGLNQALQILKRRGILLAACSKGTEAATLAVWKNVTHPLLLRPDDFVAVRINWQPKSHNIADLCRMLQIEPDQMIFLDDNPVERYEVSQQLPTICIPDLPTHRFRHYLLTSSSCEVATVTSEARSRTTTTRAMLRRKPPTESRDMTQFLRHLRIKVVVRRAATADVPRVTELLNRTHQFATSIVRLSELEVEAHIARQSSTITTMTVTDQFANYGLVGVCLIEDGTITALCVSCRVIGLDVGLPFLVAALLESGVLAHQISAHLDRTERNGPAQDVFLRAGLVEVLPGEFQLQDVARLPRLTEFPHDIEFLH